MRKPRRKNLKAKERDHIEAQLRQLAWHFDLSITTLGNLAHSLGRQTINVKRKED